MKRQTEGLNQPEGLKAVNQKCDGCFYQKPRDLDLESGKLAWGPFTFPKMQNRCPTNSSCRMKAGMRAGMKRRLFN